MTMEPVSILSRIICIVQYLQNVSNTANQNQGEIRCLADHLMDLVDIIEREISKAETIPDKLNNLRELERYVHVGYLFFQPQL